MRVEVERVECVIPVHRRRVRVHREGGGGESGEEETIEEPAVGHALHACAVLVFFGGQPGGERVLVSDRK